MVGRAAQGNPWALREIMGDDTEPTPRGGRGRAAALHPRDGARARRAPRDRVPEEVLRVVPRPRPLPAPVQAGAGHADARSREVELRLLAAAPGRRRRSSRCSRPSCPIPTTTCCSTRCRSRSTAAAKPSSRVVALPDEAQPLQGQLRVDDRDRLGVRCDQVGEAARGDHGRVGRAELAADPVDDRVDLAGEAVDEAGLQRGGGRLADHALRARRTAPSAGARLARRARPSRPRSRAPARRPANSPAAETTSKLVEVPKSTTTAGAPCRSRAATALAMRSGPTSRGSS